jgi:hypothetical protein
MGVKKFPQFSDWLNKLKEKEQQPIPDASKGRQPSLLGETLPLTKRRFGDDWRYIANDPGILSTVHPPRAKRSYVGEHCPAS